MPMAFLMQQMEWREALGDARAAKDAEALATLDSELAGTAPRSVGADRQAARDGRTTARPRRACAS